MVQKFGQVITKPEELLVHVGLPGALARFVEFNRVSRMLELSEPPSSCQLSKMTVVREAVEMPQLSAPFKLLLKKADFVSETISYRAVGSPRRGSPPDWSDKCGRG